MSMCFFWKIIFLVFDLLLGVSHIISLVIHLFGMLLAPGKSGIHGFGVFAKQPHRAGDMVY